MAIHVFPHSTTESSRVISPLQHILLKTIFYSGGVNDIFLGGGKSVIFTASWDMSVKVWNSVTFKPKDTLTGHKGSVQKVAVDSKFMSVLS